jgi:hypothetical protein
MTYTAKNIIFHGQVQGVGFRFTAHRIAIRYNLTITSQDGYEIYPTEMSSCSYRAQHKISTSVFGTSRPLSPAISQKPKSKQHRPIPDPPISRSHSEFHEKTDLKNKKKWLIRIIK